MFDNISPEGVILLGLVAFIYLKMYIPTQKTFEGLNRLKTSCFAGSLINLNFFCTFSYLSYFCTQKRETNQPFQKSTHMALVTRFMKDTLKGQTRWELQIIETETEIKLWEGHLIRDTGDIIKEVEKTISKDFADKYKEKNKAYIIEIYNREF